MPFGCISRFLKLAHGRGNAGGARHCRDLLNRAPAGNQFGKAFSFWIRQRAPRAATNGI